MLVCNKSCSLETACISGKRPMVGSLTSNYMVMSSVCPCLRGEGVQIVLKSRQQCKGMLRKVTFKVGQVQHTGLVHPVVLAAFKEGVIQVGQVGHDVLLLGLAQQHVVPLAQPVTSGCLLAVGVTIQDVIITLQMQANGSS